MSLKSNLTFRELGGGYLLGSALVPQIKCTQFGTGASKNQEYTHVILKHDGSIIFFQDIFLMDMKIFFLK